MPSCFQSVVWGAALSAKKGVKVSGVDKMAKRTIWLAICSLGLVLTLLAPLSGAPAWAQLTQLKPDVPKLDTPSEPVKPKAPSGPLKGNIQHNDTFRQNVLPGFIQGQGNLKGWGRGTMGKNVLKGKTNQLETEVESGIGIIGVKFILLSGRPPVINRVFPLTPAYKSGLQPNDVIVAVDGVPTLGLSKEEVYDMIVGTPGTTVTLSVSRSGDFSAVTMTRMDLNDISDPFVRRDYMMSM